MKTAPADGRVGAKSDPKCAIEFSDQESHSSNPCTDQLRGVKKLQAFAPKNDDSYVLNCILLKLRTANSFNCRSVWICNSIRNRFFIDKDFNKPVVFIEGPINGYLFFQKHGS